MNQEPATQARIRRANPSDAPSLADFAARTFAETFGAQNRPEDMRAFLETSYGVKQQSEEIANPDYATLLAEAGGALAGYAQLRRGPTPECVAGSAPVELYRIYVDRSSHGRGLAQRLMIAVHDAARELGGRTLWLGVWERNPRAIAFYEKCGFRDVGSHDFWVGSDRQTDRIMVTDVRRPEAVIDAS